MKSHPKRYSEIDGRVPKALDRAFGGNWRKRARFWSNSDTNLGEELMKSHPKRDSKMDAIIYVICMRKTSENVTENGLKIQAYLEIVETDSFAEIVVS